MFFNNLIIFNVKIKYTNKIIYKNIKLYLK